MLSQNNNLRPLFFEFVLFVGILTTMLFFWKYTAGSFIISLAVTLLAFIFFHSKEDAVFFIVGGVCGSITEAICISYGAWQYTNPWVLGIPAWLPFMWGSTLIFGNRFRNTFFKLEHIKMHYQVHHSYQSIEHNLAHNLVILAVVILLCSTLYLSNIGLALALTGLLLLGLLRTHEKKDLFAAVFAGSSGAVVEILGVNAGAWHYANPTLLGLPLWLPILYMVFALTVSNISASIVNILFLRKGNPR